MASNNKKINNNNNFNDINKPISDRRESQRESLLDKMSVLAGVDHIFRDQNSLYSIDESTLRKLVEGCERNRIKWINERRQLDEAKARIKDLEKKIGDNKAKIKNVQNQYTKLWVEGNKDKIEIKEMTTTLKNVRDFVKNELPSISTDQSTEPLVTFVNELSDIIEEKTEDSLDSNLFDKSEEFK